MKIIICFEETADKDYIIEEMKRKNFKIKTSSFGDTYWIDCKSVYFNGYFFEKTVLIENKNNETYKINIQDLKSFEVHK